MKTFIKFSILVLIITLGISPPASYAQNMKDSKNDLVLHVKTALSVDDAQICAVPNVAWAALAAGRKVRILFDASAVTSVAKGYGWRGWIGLSSTAMERAGLPDRERRSLAKQLKVPLDSVPHNYGEYLRFLKSKGVEIYYNSTMALLYKIPPEKIDRALQPVSLTKMLEILKTNGTYIVY